MSTDDIRPGYEACTREEATKSGGESENAEHRLALYVPTGQITFEDELMPRSLWLRPSAPEGQQVIARVPPLASEHYEIRVPCRCVGDTFDPLCPTHGVQRDV